MKPDVMDDRDKFMRGVDKAEEMILPYCHIDQDAANPFNGWRDTLFFQVAALNNSLLLKYIPQTKIERARTMLSTAS
jgi:hypothetical protein